MHLTSEQIAAILARAEELRDASQLQEFHPDIEAVIQAGEEVGLPRFAIEKAVREQLKLPARRVEKGDLVFARSSDDRFYAANVLSSTAEEVRVEFLRGGEHDVAPTDVLHARFLPGDKVVVNWPWWGAWTCTVEGYDAQKQKVTVNDGWDTVRTFPVAHVWLNKGKSATTMSRGGLILRVAGAAAIGGGILAMILTRLIP